MSQNNSTYPLSDFEAAQLMIGALNECGVKVELGDEYFELLCKHDECKGGTYKYKVVYLTQNKINGKIYVGQHSTNNLSDGYLGSGKILKNAVKKYGKENFTYKIIEYCHSQEELDKCEVHWIKFFKKRCKEKGVGCYNISESVFGNVDKANETKRKKYESGELVAWNKGKTGIYSESQLKRMSDAAIGRKQSEETKEKKRLAMIGKKRSESSINKMIKTKKENPKVFTIEERNVIAKNQISYNKNNMKECVYCKKLCNPINLQTHHNENCSHNPNMKIIKCPHCNVEGIRVSQMKRYHFDNCKHNPKNKDKIDTLIKNRETNCRKIKQVSCETGKTIRVWDSIKEAKIFHKKGNISRACQQGNKAGGYFWEYVNKK